jgi:hypothetical protein
MAVFSTRSWADLPMVLFGMKFCSEITMSDGTVVVGALVLMVSLHLARWSLDRVAVRAFSGYGRPG